MPDGYSLYSFCRYTTFGSVAKGRSFSSTAYRYGFNGKEKDNEVSGDGNEYDFGARIYDSRLGKWLSMDPKGGKYMSWSPYCFGLNNPIRFVDVGGETIGDPNSPATLMAKTQLQKTDAGKVLWKQLEASEKAIYFHTANKLGTSEEKNIYKASKGLGGSTMGKAVFEKTAKGEQANFEDFKKDNTFDESTGEWKSTSKEIHIVINVTAIKMALLTKGLIAGESEAVTNKKIDDATQFIVAEESLHSLEKQADFSNKNKDAKTGKYIEPKTMEEATSKPYGDRNNEIKAKQGAEKTTGMKEPKI